MQLEKSFTIDAPLNAVWAAINTPETVARCFPGATLDNSGGDDFTGTVKVKLGPISLTYNGHGTYVSRDNAAHKLVIEASGRDARGNGTASATVTGAMKSDGPDRTSVTMAIEMLITGRPAQFGRGVISGVTDELISQFAGCLEEKLVRRVATETGPDVPPNAPAERRSSALTEYGLAVDIGTTFCSAAVATVDGVEVLEVDGERRTHSTVLLNDDGRLLAGLHAHRSILRLPDRVERNPKRYVGRPPMLLGGEPVTAARALGALLSLFVDEAARHFDGASAAALVLTHPVAWSDDQCDVLRAAAEEAVPEADVSLLPEPVAAAVQYADDHGLAVGDAVAVYDLGGGTFDTAVLTAGGNGFELVGMPGGDPDIGGEAFDRLVFATLGEQVALEDPQWWQQVCTSAEMKWLRAQNRLLEHSRDAKEALATHPSTGHLIDGPDVDVRLTRAQLNELIGQDIERSRRLLADTIKDSGIAPAQLRGVFVCGGASRLALVQELLRIDHGPLVRTWKDPKTVVALGAATWLLRTRTTTNAQAGTTAAGRPAVTSPVTTTSATPASAPASSTAAAAPNIIPGQSIGVVELGISRLSVIGRLGEPARVLLGSDNAEIFVYPRLGMHIALQKDADQYREEVRSITVGLVPGAFAGQTAEGIGTGSTRDEVETRYGPAEGSTVGAAGRWGRYPSRGLAFCYGADDGAAPVLRIEVSAATDSPPVDSRARPAARPNRAMPTDTATAGATPSDAPPAPSRIVPGRSIDRIALGISKLAVIGRLGQPDRVLGVPGQESFLYSDLDMSVSFQLGNVEAITVGNQSGKFSGLGPFGIGIGTVRAKVAMHFGRAERSVDGVLGTWDMYPSKGVWFLYETNSTKPATPVRQIRVVASSTAADATSPDGRPPRAAGPVAAKPAPRTAEQAYADFTRITHAAGADAGRQRTLRAKLRASIGEVPIAARVCSRGMFLNVLIVATNQRVMWVRQTSLSQQFGEIAMGEILLISPVRDYEMRITTKSGARHTFAISGAGKKPWTGFIARVKEQLAR